MDVSDDKRVRALLGVETEMVRSLVVKWTKLTLLNQEHRIVTSEQTMWIIQNLTLDLADRDDQYIPSPMVTLGVVHSFHHAIEELRCAGIQATELTVSEFDNVRKGLYMIELLTNYEQWLLQNRSTDYAGLLNLLPMTAEVNDDLFIICDVEKLSSVVKAMLNRIVATTPTLYFF